MDNTNTNTRLQCHETFTKLCGFWPGVGYTYIHEIVMSNRDIQAKVGSSFPRGDMYDAVEMTRRTSRHARIQPADVLVSMVAK